MTRSHTVPRSIQTRKRSTQLGTFLTVAACMLLGGGANAQQAPQTSQHQHAGGAHLADTTSQGAGASATAASSLPWVDAEVRKIDLTTAKLTLKHGPIPNLDMPGMTMVFATHQPQLLQGLQIGDKVQVTVDKVAGQYTVQALRR